MTSEHNHKKESDKKPEIKKIDDTKVDQIILQAEEAGAKEKIQSAKNFNSDDSVKKIGEKISLTIVFVLLLLSIIQSFELFNLRSEILKGQFSAQAAVPGASGQGGSQALPGQQGGC